MIEVKEYDVIKTEDDRMGTVVLIHQVPRLAYEVEFEDAPGETIAIEPDSVKEIVWQA